MFGLGQAFTTTGIRFTYQFNPMVLASFGVVNGWDNVDDNNKGKTLEYLLALTPHEKVGVSWYGSYGPEQANRNFGDTFTPTNPAGPTPTGGAAGNPSAKRFANGLIITLKANGQGHGGASSPTTSTRRAIRWRRPPGRRMPAGTA